MLQRAGDTRAARSVIHAQQDPTPFIGEKSKQPTSLSLNEADSKRTTLCEKLKPQVITNEFSLQLKPSR